MAFIWQRLIHKYAITFRVSGLNLISNYKARFKNFELLPYSTMKFGNKKVGTNPVKYSTDTLKNASEGVLPSTRDRFNGNTVDTDQTPIDPDKFSEQLKKSLDWWSEQNSRAIWFKVGLQHSHLIPVLVDNYFSFHHAREDFVMMLRKLDAAAAIPSYAHTLVGIGGIVINDKDQILAISEDQSMIPGSWNIPGGYVDPGENLTDAVVREIFEETGIRTCFESLVQIRHSLNCKYNCSDIYIVMSLRTIGDTSIVHCPREILEAKWMDFDEFQNHPKVHDINRDLICQYMRNRRDGMMMTCKEQTLATLQHKYDVFSMTRTEG